MKTLGMLAIGAAVASCSDKWKEDWIGFTPTGSGTAPDPSVAYVLARTPPTDPDSIRRRDYYRYKEIYGTLYYYCAPKSYLDIDSGSLVCRKDHRYYGYNGTCIPNTGDEFDINPTSYTATTCYKSSPLDEEENGDYDMNDPSVALSTSVLDGSPENGW